jgi:serine phosphatase RsbU (regulator of sigma subunit)
MRKQLRLIFCLCAFHHSFLAGVSLDSLKRVVEAMSVDTAAVKKIIRLSDKMSTHDQTGAEFLARKAFTLAEKLNDKSTLYSATSNLGNKLLNRGNYMDASVHLLHALRLAEELNNKDWIARSCNGLGNLFGLQDQAETALKYYERALTHYKAVNNKARMEVVLTNMGNIYYSKSYYGKKYLKQAEEKYQQVHDILKEMQDTLRSIANMNNLALVYGDEGRNREALVLLEQTEVMCKVIDDNYDLIFATSYLGRTYNHIGQPDSAIPYLNLSLDIARKMNNVMMIADGNANLAESYSQEKDFENAYRHQVLYQGLHDSLLNSDNTNKIAEAQGKYEDEKKQRRIELLELNANHEHRIYSYITWSLVAGSVLLLLLALLMYNRYSLKNKSQNQLTLQNQIIAQKNKDITDSINYAKKIQEAMLPAVSQIQKAFPQSFVIYQPKDIVSGDFYWFSEKQGKYFIAVVDCTGHGVPGAFMSMIGNDMLYDAVADKGLIVPGEVLTSLNQQVKNSLKQNDTESGSRDGMDAVLCVFEKDLLEMNYSGANRPLYVMRDDVIEIKEATKASIGGLTDSGQVFDSKHFSLQKGDTIYLFSDGFCDQFGGQSGKKFTTKRFRALLEQIKDQIMADQEKSLNRTFLEWKRENEQVDDVLVVGIRI